MLSPSATAAAAPAAPREAVTQVSTSAPLTSCLKKVATPALAYASLIPLSRRTIPGLVTVNAKPVAALPMVLATVT